MNIIAIPLGWIMRGCYYVCKNYGIALLLFTFLTRLLVFPLSIKQQKSTARMGMLKPKLDELQKKYGKNQQKLQEEQMKLYSEAGVNPMASCLPMLISLVILWSLIPVIYGPLTYVSGIDKDEIESSNKLISNLSVVCNEIKSKDTTVEKLLKKYEDKKDPYASVKKLITNDDKYPKSAKALNANSEANDIIEVFKLHNDIDKFVTDESYFSQNLIQSRPELMTFVFTQNKDMGDYSDVIGVASEEVQKYSEDFNYDLFGVSMGTIPSWKKITCIIPILCFLLQLLVTVVSQRFSKQTNPEAANMKGMTAMLYIMPLFSLWLGFSFPLGMGLYWCYSSVISLIQTIVLHKIYTPEHVAELVERDIAKQKASGKQTMMQRMAEAQLVAAGKDPAEIRKEAGGDDYEEPKKKSKNELKEEQRRKLNEARRRMAEKYGDEYEDDE